MLAAAALAGAAGAAFAGDAERTTQALPGMPAGTPVAVETVRFADPRLPPVRLLRGVPGATPAVATPRAAPPPPVAAAPPTVVPPQRTQIVSFGTGFAEQVKIVRGGLFVPASLGNRPGAAKAGGEKVGFGASRQPVTVLRGAIRELFSIDLFGPANGGELDRLAFAVDGVESRHGADPGMWRPSPTGPQGPMQVSAAAAFDVGGGDRFDIYQNRLLGRAYLAQMFQRYGNWQDALAAYNWGPGNMDLWIAGGRDADRLPPGVAYYVARVLRDALITTAARR